MNMTKVEMQMGECLHQKQLVKETAGARVIRSKDSCVGREEEQFTRKAVPATEFMESDSKREDPGIHRLDKSHLHDNLSHCKGKKEEKRKLIILTVTAIRASFTDEATGPSFTDEAIGASFTDEAIGPYFTEEATEASFTDEVLQETLIESPTRPPEEMFKIW